MITRSIGALEVYHTGGNENPTSAGRVEWRDALYSGICHTNNWLSSPAVAIDF